MVQACLNGPRLPGSHLSLPVTPDQLAAAARGVVAAGADDIHLHPKTTDGYDSLDPRVVDAAVLAVRLAVEGVTVGVTTATWHDAADPVAHIVAWTVLPDHASVNWHLDGADDVAGALLDRGIAVHAGIFSGTDAAARLRRSSHVDKIARVLAEVVTPEPGVAEALLSKLDGLGPILLHGEGDVAWPMVRLALSLGLDTRIGLEDTLTLPDGTVAPDNAALVRALLTLE